MAGNSPVYGPGWEFPLVVAQGVAGKPGLFLPGRTVYFCPFQPGVQQDDALRLRQVSVREPEDKNLDLQVERLVRAGCSLGNIRAEEASGARNDRGGLLELLDLALVREYLEPTEVYEKRPPRGRRSEPVRERAPEPVRMALYAVQRGVCPGCGIFPPHFLRFEVDHIVALADNVATGVMLDERQAVLTGRRLAQYHRERPEQ